VRLQVLIIFSYVFFSLCIIIITYSSRYISILALSRVRELELFVRSCAFSGDHGASPPLSEIRLKQDEYWGGHGKNGIGG